jgi:hypothetical protein
MTAIAALDFGAAASYGVLLALNWHLTPADTFSRRARAFNFVILPAGMALYVALAILSGGAP